MPEPLPSQRFQRTRDDHASETAEDYVEAIADMVASDGVCRVTRLADVFGVSHVTALKVIRRLDGEGLVIAEPRQPIVLTEKGRRLARRCRARHELVERFLCAIGVNPKVAAIDAEGIEHHVSQQTLARMQDFLDDSM